MKNTFLPFVFCLFLMACSHEMKTGNELTFGKDAGYATESRNENILEQLYLELKEQRPELQALEKQIEEVDLEKGKALKEYNTYDNKNKQYYTIANQNLKTIQDSLLRNSIELLLNKSQYAYEQDNAAMALSAAQLENRSASLHDHYEALKIILTMHQIEKYQKKIMLSTNEHQKITDRYNKTLNTADSLLQAK